MLLLDLDGFKASENFFTAYVERRDALVRLTQKYLADYVESLVPVGGLQLPCILINGMSERKAIEAEDQAGINVLGLTALYMACNLRPGFLIGFAACSPGKLESAVRTLANIFHALDDRTFSFL